MGSHLATTETYFHEAPEFTGLCWVCDANATLQLGWIGVRCSKCNSVFNLEDTWCDIVRRRRQVMKLTRRQMAVLLGYSVANVKRCEWVSCSREYFKRTLSLIKEQFKP